MGLRIWDIGFSYMGGQSAHFAVILPYDVDAVVVIFTVLSIYNLKNNYFDPK